jgi:hypothetical protein
MKAAPEIPGNEDKMELTPEQEATFRGLCKEIKPGEYGRVVVSFVGEPSNLVQITGEKNYRFRNEKAEPSAGEAVPRRGPGRH